MAELPTYISLADAADRFRVSRTWLTHLVESGKIRAVKLDGGKIAVAEGDVDMTVQHASKRDELWKRVKHLDGNPIGVGDARKKYALGAASLNRWIELGYVRVIDNTRGGGRGRKRILNEADVAYAALVANERGRRPGKRIFTPEFVPPHIVMN